MQAALFASKVAATAALASSNAVASIASSNVGQGLSKAPTGGGGGSKVSSGNTAPCHSNTVQSTQLKLSLSRPPQSTAKVTAQCTGNKLNMALSNAVNLAASAAAAATSAAVVVMNLTMQYPTADTPITVGEFPYPLNGCNPYTAMTSRVDEPMVNQSDHHHLAIAKKVLYSSSTT